MKIVWILRRAYTIKWHVWAPVHQVYSGNILNNSAVCFLPKTKISVVFVIFHLFYKVQSEEM